jgi:hypothetical protein
MDFRDRAVLINLFIEAVLTLTNILLKITSIRDKPTGFFARFFLK